MSSIVHSDLPTSRHDQWTNAGGRRWRMRLWLLLPVLAAALGVSALTYTRVASLAATPRITHHVSSALPADLFIQSIVKDDGALGWQQLCPTVQAQVSRDMVAQQADEQRSLAAQGHLTLNSDFIGARPQPAGGELRVYVLTAHWPNGAAQQRTYSVLTQASGCVEDVLTQ